MSRHQFLFLALLLGLFSIMGQVSVDTFLPAMPAVAKALGTDVGAVQVSLAALFSGAAIGQLVYGPLSDRFGRKPIILGAVILFLVTALGASSSADVETLIAWRFVQGFSTAAGRQLTAASARDLLDKERLGRMLSYVMVVAACSAIVAPVAGGYLTQAFGWRSVFIYQVGLAVLVIILVSFYFTETLKEKDPNALSPAGLRRNYLEILGNPTFLAYGLVSAIMLAGLSAFLTTSSGILIRGFGLSPAMFGYLFATVMVGHVLGAWAAARLVERIGIGRTLLAGTLACSAGALAMLIPALAGAASAAMVVAPMFVFMGGFSLAYPQAIAGAMSPFPHIAGTAASIAGFAQGLAAAGTAALLSRFSHQTPLPLAVTLSLLALAGLVLAVLLAFRGRWGSGYNSLPAGE